MLRNGQSGYGSLTKVLHWATVAAVGVQFVIGYVMDVDDSGRGRGRGRGSLPPWSEALSDAERRLAHWTERLLLGSLLVVPATGVVLVLGGDDDLVWLHVTAHVVFFCALAAHLCTNLRPRVLRRMV